MIGDPLSQGQPSLAAAGPTGGLAFAG